MTRLILLITVLLASPALAGASLQITVPTPTIICEPHPTGVYLVCKDQSTGKIIMVQGHAHSGHDDHQLFRGFVVDLLRVGVPTMADTYFTARALRLNPRAREGNGLIPDAESRIAVKAAGFALIAAGNYQLRKSGHPGWAKWIGRGAGALYSGLAFHNWRVSRRR